MKEEEEGDTVVPAAAAGRLTRIKNSILTTSSCNDRPSVTDQQTTAMRWKTPTLHKRLRGGSKKTPRIVVIQRHKHQSHIATVLHQTRYILQTVLLYRACIILLNIVSAV